ncbi:tyrosine-type recombinase/integrase [Nonomuraea sp. bgisy101]|uniref:tyrosine-type recombinase/integrase n=1 Tax=Nonomuraea sp. bgisy101 TaxID=3413784 RepID=UPI003D72B883
MRYELPAGPGGKRRRPWAGPFPNETIANKELTRLLAEAGSGAPVPDRQLTFRRFLRDQWLPGKVRLKASTRQSYQEVVDLYGDPGLGHLKLGDVREHHLHELYEAMGQINNLPEGAEPSEMLRRLLAARATAEWRENGGLHSSRPLSASRIHLAHRVLSSALSYAFKTRKIGHDPSKHVEPPRVTRPKPLVWTAARVERWRRTGHVPGPVMVWTPQIAGEFLDHCEEKKERLYPLFHLTITRGLRRGDARRMEWPDLDLEVGTLSVLDQGESGPKTEAGVRTIDLDDENVRLLKAWRVQQGRERLRAGESWVASEVVFTRRNGEPLREEFASQRFEVLVRRAGLPPIRFHDLRHCAATFGLAAGNDMKVISATLGHSKHSFTADTYTSVVPQLAKAAAEATVAIIPRRSRKAGG